MALGNLNMGIPEEELPIENQMMKDEANQVEQNSMPVTDEDYTVNSSLAIMNAKNFGTVQDIIKNTMQEATMRARAGIAEEVNSFNRLRDAEQIGARRAIGQGKESFILGSLNDGTLTEDEADDALRDPYVSQETKNQIDKRLFSLGSLSAINENAEEMQEEDLV